ncbi:MAG: hypothetical protein V1773_04725 [bacterium]
MFLSAFDLFAQIDANTPKALKEFIQMRDSLVENFAEKKGFTKTFSEKEIYDVAKVYYNVLAKNSSEYRMFIDEEYKRVSALSRNGKATIVNMPTHKLGLLSGIITKQYGATFFRTEMIPYFLRVKINKKTSWNYISGNKKTYSAVKLMCSIEDVIKGDNRFSINDIVLINYFDLWFEDTNITFLEGGTYFIPVESWDGMNDNYNGFSLAMLDDNNRGIYPIIDGEVITKGNIFGIGERTNWEEFKINFSEKYINLFELEGK